MLTKQMVFAKYTANPEQRFVASNRMADSILLYGVTKDWVIWLWEDEELTYDPIAECTLLLKDQDDMSEEHKKIYKDICFKFWLASVDSSYLKLSIELTNFLIQNGYCLDKEWVKAGWVKLIKD
jgi:hypothetical protein